MTTNKTRYFIMPNGKRLRTCGRFDNPELLYHEVTEDYHNTPASRSITLIARWAQVSDATVQNILKAYSSPKRA